MAAERHTDQGAAVAAPADNHSGSEVETGCNSLAAAAVDIAVGMAAGHKAVDHRADHIAVVVPIAAADLVHCRRWRSCLPHP